MPVLLVTMAIGEKYLEEYTRLFRPSHEQYAKSCGYDFKVIEDYIDGTRRHADNISYQKALISTTEWSKEYDFVIYIDADILINVDAPPIHEFCLQTDKVCMVDEYSQPTPAERLVIQKRNGWETSASAYYKLQAGVDLETTKVLNGGMYVFQPKLHSKFMQSIYDKYIDKQIGHPSGYHWEQSTIGYELQKNDMVHVLPNAFNAIWPICKKSNEFKELLTFFKQNWFTHFCSGCDHDKIELLQEYNMPSNT